MLHIKPDMSVLLGCVTNQNNKQVIKQYKVINIKVLWTISCNECDKASILISKLFQEITRLNYVQD